MMRDQIAATLRRELEQEADEGFPRVKRIPSTRIIAFIDYFASLDAAERKSLLEAMARSATVTVAPSRDRALDQHEYQQRDSPAFVRMQSAMSSPEYGGGYRYTGVKMIRMMRSDPESWTLFSGTLSGRAAQPREDLLPNLDLLVTAKAPLLRKLVKITMTDLLGKETRKLPGGETGYSGVLHGMPVTVWVDYGSMVGQLRYGVSILDPGRAVRFVRLSYESLWGAHLGWDYITEENAQRSIELLGQHVAHLVDLNARLNANVT
jgi:hypothetical protein